MTEKQPTTFFSYDGIRRADGAAAAHVFTYDSQEIAPLDGERWAARPKPCEHPLLGRWEGFVLGAVSWQQATPEGEATLEVELRPEQQTRRLRFLGVSYARLRLGGKPRPFFDTRMMDLTPLGQPGRGVEVRGGACGGPLQLLARVVVELPSRGEPGLNPGA